MNEGIPIGEARKLFPEVEELAQKLERGEISACACLGPMYDEPYCGCEMVSRELERSSRVAIETAEANERLKKLFEHRGWFYEIKSKGKEDGNEEQRSFETSTKKS